MRILAIAFCAFMTVGCLIGAIFSAVEGRDVGHSVYRDPARSVWNSGVASDGGMALLFGAATVALLRAGRGLKG